MVFEGWSWTDGFHNQVVNFSTRLGDFGMRDVTAERCTAL